MWKSPARNFVGWASAKKAPLSESSVALQARDPVALERRARPACGSPARSRSRSGCPCGPRPTSRAGRSAATPPSRRRSPGRSAPCCRSRRRCPARRSGSAARAAPRRSRRASDARAAPGRSCRSWPCRSRSSRPRRSRSTRAEPGGSAGRTSRGRRPGRRRRTPGRSPPCRPPPSGRRSSPSCPSFSSRITRRVGRQGLLGRRHGRQRLVVDVDQLEGVLRDVRVLRDHGGDLLALEADLVRREHGLGVAGERRHPRQVVLRHQLAGHDRHDPGQGRGSSTCRPS